MKQAAWSLALVMLFACGPSMRPAYQKDVEATLAVTPGDRDIGPRALEPQPWKVGQWALYKTVNDGKVGYDRYTIIEEDDCGVWVETVHQDAYTRQVSKTCFSRMPWVESDSVGDVLDLMQVVVAKTDDGSVQTWDFRANPEMREHAKSMFQSVLSHSFAWVNDDRLPRKTIEVPAGRFAGAAKFKSSSSVMFFTIEVTALIHTAVPVYAIVRSSTNRGQTMELVDYGQQGGESVWASL